MLIVSFVVVSLERKLIVRFFQDNFFRRHQSVIRNRKLKKDRQCNGQQKGKQRSTKLYTKH
jgi:hypothetical protein